MLISPSLSIFLGVEHLHPPSLGFACRCPAGSARGRTTSPTWRPAMQTIQKRRGATSPQYTTRVVHRLGLTESPRRHEQGGTHAGRDLHAQTGSKGPGWQGSGGYDELAVRPRHVAGREGVLIRGSDEPEGEVARRR